MSSIPSYNRLCFLGLTIATLISYANSLDGAWYLDDYACIVQNDSLDTLLPAHADIPPGLKHRDVGRMSFTLNYWLGDSHPVGFHAVNMLIHLAAGCTLFGLLRRTLELPSGDAFLRKRATAIAFATALLWLVHPLQTESVTYIVQRLESLMSLCFLVCLYSILRGAASVDKSRLWYLLAIICFWFGISTKEVMVTALPVALLFDRIFLAKTWRELASRRWGLYAAMAPVILWVIIILNEAPVVDGQATAGFAMADITPWSYLMTQAQVIWHYLYLIIFPLELCLDYQWPIVDNLSEAILPGISLIGLLIACLLALKSQPRIAFLGLSFFLVLAPTSSIMPIADAAVEHRTYLVSAAVITLLVVAAAKLSAKLLQSQTQQLRYFAIAVGGAALLFMALTAERNRLYCQPIQMWHHVVAQATHNDRAHYNLGCAYCREHRFASGEPHLRRALELAPQNPTYLRTLRRTVLLRQRLHQVSQADQAKPSV